MFKLYVILVANLLSAPWAGTVYATSIYRCIGSDGVIKFQDKPCLVEESGRRIELADPPPASYPAAPEVTAAETIDNSALESGSARRAAAMPIPSTTLCTREDGSRYLSESGRGEQRLVPLGVLGVPSESLADAYAGRDGIGVSAPGLRDPPSDHSQRGRLGALYTRIEDPCERISESQFCEFLDSEISDAERRLRLAFSDTQEGVRRELEALHQRADRCPR